MNKITKLTEYKKRNEGVTHVFINKNSTTFLGQLLNMEFPCILETEYGKVVSIYNYSMLIKIKPQFHERLNVAYATSKELKEGILKLKSEGLTKQDIFINFEDTTELADKIKEVVIQRIKNDDATLKMFLDNELPFVCFRKRSEGTVKMLNPMYTGILNHLRTNKPLYFGEAS